MADHRSEDIVAAVLTTVTGLATTGANAFRGRTYEIPETSVPCVCVYQGGDFPLTNTSPWKFIDSELSIVVEAIVKDSSVQAETTLNQIRYEVANALQADITLGLAYVMNTTEGSATITLDGSTNEIVGRMRMEWVVLYRRLRYTTPAPVFVSATILADGVSLEVVFDRPIVSGSATAGFSRSVGSISSGAISGSTVTLTIPESFIGENAGTITYNTGTGSLSGVDSEVESFGPVAITNNSTQTRTAPTLTGWIVAANGTSVTLTFSENITGNPALGFSMTADAVSVSLTGGAIAGSQITFTAGTTVYQGQMVLGSYSSATGDIAGAEADLATFSNSAVTNNSTQSAGPTISAVGSGLYDTEISSSFSGMAGLDSGSFAYLDANNDRIRRYTVNTGSGAIAFTTNGSKAVSGVNMTNVGTNAIGYYYYTLITGIVRQYAWNGAAWDDSTTSGQATISGSTTAQCCKVATNIMAVSTDNGDRTFSWGSDVYTQVTTTSPGTGTGPRPMAYLSENNVAVFSPSGGGYLLATYVWNGSTYAISGNALTVAVANITSATAMNGGARVVAYSRTTRTAYVYDRSGADWVLTGSAQVGTAAVSSHGWICGIPGTQFFIHADITDRTFRLYSVA